MGIVNGKRYIASLQDHREVWLEGQKVQDVTTAPGLCRSIHTLADFLDRQQEDAYIDKLTYVEDGERYGTSFLIPHSVEDVKRRGAAYYEWAK